jgi:uncharacterized protein YaiI (UPF0178 family)
MIGPGDVAVTQDYGLAAMCLARKAFPISQDGLEYTDENIDALLLALTRPAGYAPGRRLKAPQKEKNSRTPCLRMCFGVFLQAVRTTPKPKKRSGHEHLS